MPGFHTLGFQSLTMYTADTASKEPKVDRREELVRSDRDPPSCGQRWRNLQAVRLLGLLPKG